MNPRKSQVIDFLATELHRRRLELLNEVGETEGELHTIAQEQGSELEENAQKERIAALLKRLGDRERQGLQEIDEALQRIASGTYGKCDRCKKSIPVERLRALPTARLCVDCARARESKRPTATGNVIAAIREGAPYTLPSDPPPPEEEE